MIRNEREYRITQAQAKRFRRALAQLDASPNGCIHPRLQKAQRDALESQLADLEAELKQYDQLRTGRRRVIKVNSFEELPSALIQARIALGLTQRELAERLGLKEQQIQRYEATNYASASLARVAEIIQAMQLDVKEELRLPKPPPNNSR
ncbi:MAG: helix-turn-helix transcriptional regulator [Planctomycetes bacterium]|nr:helix-turn-helix transcriptional regulator [Planctomycetota bacterium]